MSTNDLKFSPDVPKVVSDILSTYIEENRFLRDLLGQIGNTLGALCEGKDINMTRLELIELAQRCQEASK